MPQPDDVREEERRLVGACVRGDSGAWRDLAARFGPGIASRIVRIYRRRLGRAPAPAEIQEISQEVFVRLAANRARSLRNFRWRCGLATYLSAVAGTCAIDRIRADAARRERRGRRVDLAVVAESLPSEGAEPLDEALLAERRATVRLLMRDLPDRERLALRMYYWEGMRPAAIARGLGTTEDYVWVLLKRARDRFRRKASPRLESAES